MATVSHKLPAGTTQSLQPGTIPTITPIKQAPALQVVRYNLLVSTYAGNQDVVVDPKCNGWTAINKGTLVARVNGIPLNPPPAAGLSGESYTVGGNMGELYEGRLQVVVGVGDPTPLVVIIQKIYI